jgi:hypothetical protein
LALHNDIGRQVRDAHRRFGPVDVLPASTTSPVHVDTQIGWVYLDIDIVVNLW